MKKIANFTQTYKVIPQYISGADGKDREYLFDFQIRDKATVYLKSKLDFHNISFHNYDEESALKILDKVKTVLPETTGFYYNNMTYAMSFLTHLKILKQDYDITDIFWLQDDDFVVYNSLEDLDMLIEYYKNDPSLVNISFHNYKANLDLHNGSESINIPGEKVSHHLVLYRTTCTDFYKLNGHPLPSGACLCSIDILISILESFNENLNTTDAYQVEGLMGSIGLSRNLQRCILNIPIIRAYNITGMGGSLASSEMYLQELQKKL